MEVLPHLSLISSPDGRDVQLELLKLLAELIEYCGTLEKPEEKVLQLYNALIVCINIITGPSIFINLIHLFNIKIFITILDVYAVTSRNRSN